MNTIAAHDNSLLRQFERFSRAISVVTIAVGVLVLVGWWVDVSALKSVLPGLATMKANTALGFIFLGTALRLQQPRPVVSAKHRLAGHVCAAVPAFLGLLTLAEYFFRIDLRFDELLFRDTANVGLLPPPGRMAHATALGLLVFGVGLWLLDSRTRQRALAAQLLALAGAVAGLIALAGYVYGVRQLYGVVAYSSVALHTAILFILFGLGVLCARPAEGLMTVVTCDYAGGFVARRILPVALVLPFVIAWLRLKGQQAGWYGTEFGLALLATSSAVIFAMVVWWNARSLNAADAQRRRTEETLRATTALRNAILDSAGYSIIAADNAGRIHTFNRAAERMLGYTSAEMLGQTPERLHDLEEMAQRARELSVELRRPIPPGLEVFLARPRLTGTYEERYWTYIRKDGTRFPVLLSVAPLLNADNQTVGFVGIASDVTESRQAEEALRQAKADLEIKVTERTSELEARNLDLTEALDNVKELAGLLPICGYCKKIRDGDQYWHQVEKYVAHHSNARFSHGVCPDCFEKHLKPDLAKHGITAVCPPGRGKASL